MRQRAALVVLALCGLAMARQGVAQVSIEFVPIHSDPSHSIYDNVYGLSSDGSTVYGLQNLMQTDPNRQDPQNPFTWRSGHDVQWGDWVTCTYFGEYSTQLSVNSDGTKLFCSRYEAEPGNF
jgi:hypothetical protein